MYVYTLFFYQFWPMHKKSSCIFARNTSRLIFFRQSIYKVKIMHKRAAKNQVGRTIPSQLIDSYQTEDVRFLSIHLSMKYMWQVSIYRSVIIGLLDGFSSDESAAIQCNQYAAVRIILDYHQWFYITLNDMMNYLICRQKNN